MKVVRRAVIAASVLVTLSPVSAQAAMATECNGVFTGTADAIIVPTGSVCELLGATVLGDVTAEAGTRLISDFSSIGGDITAVGPFTDMAIHFSTVGRDVRASGLVGVSSFNSIIGGDFAHTDGGSVIFVDNDVGGDIRIERNNGSELGVASNTVGGEIIFADNILAPGGPQGYFEVRDNTVGKSVRFLRNSGASTILRNVIDGSLVCLDNEPPPASAANSAKKFKGQCTA